MTERRPLPFRRPLPRLLAILVLALPLLARAQSVHWSPPEGTLAVGKLEDLSLVFEDCEPKDDPAPPTVPGLTLVQRGRSENFSMVNFKTSRSVTYAYAARLETKKSVTIPAFDIETDKGRLHVAAAHFDPTDATIGASQKPVSDVVQSHLKAPTRSVYVGEVFPLTYRLEVRRDYFNQILSNPEWNPSPLAAEDWVKPTQASGNQVLVIPYTARAYAKSPGTFTLNSVQQQISIQTGSTQSFFFSQPVLESLAVTSDQPKLVVKALPQPAPGGFEGAVGQFTFTSKVVPQKARVGEPITWTLELKGTGNWPDIGGVPARDVPRSFEVVQPQAKRSSPENKLFDGSVSEDVVLIPKEPGLFTLPSVTFAYFDPETDSYKTVTTQRVTLSIEPAKADTSGAAPSPAASATPSGPGRPAVAETPAPARPTQPILLPSDPAKGHAATALPLGDGVMAALAAAPFAALALLWLALATLRARRADPQRPRREAAARLRALLGQMLGQGAKGGADAATREALRGWQREVALVLELRGAAPSPASIEAAAAPQAAEYARLWREADATLYGESVALPADWISRAMDAAAKTSVPGFKAWTAFHPRNLTPWFFAIALAALLAPALTLNAAVKDPAMPTSDPLKAYASGDFAAAAQGWQDRLDQVPTDWRARNNLGLALLQQGQDEAATAQLAVAFLHAPDNPLVLRNFRLAMQEARLIPDVIGGLAMDHPLSDVARAASPAGWQLVLVLGALAAAAGAAIGLVSAYRARSTGARWASATLFTLGLCVGAVALACLAAYGPARDTHAALVARNTTLYSIPTEAETTQKTSALSSGVILVVDHSFLGWRHVRFSGGQSGWVRKDDLVMLWR